MNPEAAISEAQIEHNILIVCVAAFTISLPSWSVLVENNVKTSTEFLLCMRTSESVENYMGLPQAFL